MALFYVGKRADRTLDKPPSNKLKDQLLLSFYVMFHPFKGFWDIKYEGIGNVKVATIFFVLLNLFARKFYNVLIWLYFSP